VTNAYGQGSDSEATIAATSTLTPTRAPTRRRGAWWFGVGAALSGLVYCWVITAGSFDLFARQRFGADFFDVQAHRLLSGHLDMPEDVLLIEAFSNAGKSYMYFGPTPALLRLPIALVTDRLDGRLTQLSMLLAFAVAMWFSGRLLLRARDAVRRDAPWTRLELAWTAGAAFAIGTGSSLLFLGSKPWVYHEASMWGIAFALGAFVAILDVITNPSPRAIVRAGALTSLALLARLAVGLGPLVALGLVALVAIIIRVRPAAASRVARLSGSVPGVGKVAVGVVAAAVVPFALYVAVNFAKFDTPFSIPFERQAQNAVDPHRRAVLDANNGSLINVKALPTTILAYARPDTVRLTTTFPFVTFREERASVIGDVEFDLVDREAGIPAAMPALAALAVGGIVVVFWRRREPEDGDPAAWRLPLLGAAAALIPTLTIVYVAQRYVADFMPVLLLGAAVGVQALARACAARRAVARVGAWAVVVLAVWSCWANIALAYEFRHAFAPFTADDLRAARIGTQLDVADALGTGAPTAQAGAKLPATARAGDLFVVGDCAGLYWYDGQRWLGVERTNRTGRHLLEVTRRAADVGAERVLVRTSPGDGAASDRIVLHLLDDDRARLVAGPAEGEPTLGRPFSLARGDSAVFDTVLDRRAGDLIVTLDGATVLGAAYDGAGGTRAVTGTRDGVTVRDLPVSTDVCQRLDVD
jgi:hypothetical protein